MGASALDHVLTFGRIILAAVKGDQKAILANVALFDDDAGNPAGGANEQAMYGTAGFYCRPMPPDDRGVCEGIVASETDAATVVASRDLRCNARVNPSEGELGIAHYGGGFLSLSWDDDKRGTLVVISAPRLDSALEQTEAAHAIILDPSSGNASIQILHQLGSGLVANKDGDISISNAGATNAAARVTCHADGSITLQADKGLKVTGASVMGDVTQAREVALVQEVAAALQTIVVAIGKLSTQLQVLGGAGAADDVAQLAANLVQVQTTGTARTLKASPQ